jgi:AcrR family transcriptional regulator
MDLPAARAGRNKTLTDQAVRTIRADARRNEDALLEAAKEVFATDGVDAPVREIAARAGVGTGTLYRRFPKRSDLISAVFRREIDACVAAADALAADSPPEAALAGALMRYTQFIATKRGLAAALHSGDPAYDELPVYFRTRFEPVLQSLLEAAAAGGAIRSDIAAYDLLRAIGNLSVATGEDSMDHIRRMVALLIDGLRYGATARSPDPAAQASGMDTSG